MAGRIQGDLEGGVDDTLIKYIDQSALHICIKFSIKIHVLKMLRYNSYTIKVIQFKYTV